MSDRDPNADSASSPYDESTGQIPVNPDARVRRRLIPAAERDEFYAQHAAPDPNTAEPDGMARVDDLDDIDPAGVDAAGVDAADVDADLAGGDPRTTPMVVARATPQATDRPQATDKPQATDGLWAAPAATTQPSTPHAAAPPPPGQPGPPPPAPNPAPGLTPQQAPAPQAPTSQVAPTRQQTSTPPSAPPSPPMPPPAATRPVAPRNEPTPTLDPMPTPTRAEPVVVTPEANRPDAPTEAMAVPVAAAPAAGAQVPPPVVPPPTDPLPAQRYDAETVALESPGTENEVVDEEPTALEHELADARRHARRGTLDLGLLLLRVAVGLIALAHGTQKLFGWWNGPRLSGYEDFLANSSNPAIGFHADAVKPLAIVGALSETLGGLMLVIGLFTPIAAAAVLGVMLMAAAYKSTLAGGVWFFAADQNGAGIEYELLLAVCAAAIILTGPGRISLDAPRGWARRPAWGSVALLVLGVVAAVVVWILFNGTNPFESPGNPTV